MSPNFVKRFNILEKKFYNYFKLLKTFPTIALIEINYFASPIIYTVILIYKK